MQVMSTNTVPTEYHPIKKINDIEMMIAHVQQKFPLNRITDTDRAFAIFVHVAFSRVIKVLVPEATTRWLISSGIGRATEGAISAILDECELQVAEAAQEILDHMIAGETLTAELVIGAIGPLFEDLINYSVDGFALLDAVTCE